MSCKDIPKSILDVDCESYDEWFRGKTEEELIEFFAFPKEYTIYMIENNHRSVENVLSAGFIEYEKMNKFQKYQGNYSINHKDAYTYVNRSTPDPDSKHIDELFKNYTIEGKKYSQLRTLRGIYQSLIDCFNEDLFWLNVFKFQFLRKILIKISDLYYFASGFDNDDPRSGRTRLRSPYNRVQNLVKEKEKQDRLRAEEKRKSDDRIAAITKISNQLAESFDLYLPVTEDAIPWIKAKAAKYFEANFKIDNPQPYVDYISAEYKKIEDAEDKELLGFNRFYIQSLIELYPV